MAGNRWKWIGHLTEFRVSLLTALVAVALFWALNGTGLFRKLEGLLLDARFQIRGTLESSGDIALVHIDDKSMEAYGRWPWSRSQIAGIVDQLSAAGARVIALDILFIEAENSLSGQEATDARAVLDSLDAGDLPGALSTFRQAMPDWHQGRSADDRLAQALADAGNVVIPYSLDLSTDSPPPDDGRINSVWDSAFLRTRVAIGSVPVVELQSNRILAPLPQLGASADTMGHVNVPLDVDGTGRFEYPVLGFEDEFVPSFALQIARKMLDLPPEDMEVAFGVGVQVGPVFVPTDENMRMLANYYGPPGVLPTYSAADVMDNRVPADTFAGKTVLVGVHGVGVSDVFVTPYSAVLPGVERVANMVDNIVTGRFIERANRYWAYDIAVILGASLILGLVGGRLTSIGFSFAALSLAGIVAAGNYAAFVLGGMWLNLTFPLVALLLTYSSITIVTYLRQEQRERTTRRAFDQYLHPALVDALCENPDVLKLGGERKDLTVLFSDVRNFSTIAEGLAPEVLVSLMNEYFDATTEAVVSNHGLLDKYIGDELMAVFGAPLPTSPEDQALNACHAALAMVEAAKRLSASWVSRGYGSLDIGVGINTGDMVIGNMGSQNHFDYTVMGDEVNVGSRLEQLNKTFGTNILISGRTHELVADKIATRELDLVNVKGRTHPVPVFEVLGTEPIPADRQAFRERFEDALATYRNRRFEESIAKFEAAEALRPGDLACDLFIRRCNMLISNPPPEDWNGIAPDRRVASYSAGAAA